MRVEPTAADRAPHRRRRPAMGTFVDVSIVDDLAIDVRGRERALAAAFDAIDRVASLMSFHDPASDLSRLNARAHMETVRVDRWTSDVLRLARRLHVETDGHFDCTIGSSLIDAGLLPVHDHAHDDAHAREPSNGRASFDDVEFLDDDRVAYRTRLAIDLGGIAKGFAVDRAIDALRAHGVRAAVVNAGGDLRVLGDDAIPIFVRDTRDASLRWAGTLADGAFATSSCFGANPGVEFEASEWPAQAPSALVDPFTRHILSTGKRYSIVAPTCAIADGLTKALASTDGLRERCLRAFDAVQLVH